MTHYLPPLRYAYDALEPHIDAQTMTIHHTKHHQAYVDNLNKALENHADLQALGADDLIKDLNHVPEDIRTAVRNNGGGHVNHSMFWEIMGPGGGGQPSGELGRAITDAFGGFDAFKTQISQAGMTRFGSGWAWLSLDGDNLRVESTANQDNPLMEGRHPVFGIDVWEHAYYLKYQNRRKDYLDAWWDVVKWDHVAERYAKLRG